MTVTVSYPAFVDRLCKDGQEIIDGLTPEKAHLLHMAVGMAEEAGELLALVKAHVFYGKPLNVEKVVEELGDGRFFSEGFRQGLNRIAETGEAGYVIDWDYIEHANKTKLSQRYRSLTFSNEAAIARADKGPGEE